MKIQTYRDPLVLTLDIINDRKKSLILYELERTKKQAYEIATALPYMKREEVNDQIAKLVEMGLVARKIHVRKKPRIVEYALTNEGAMLLRSIRSIMEVGIHVMMQYGMEDVLEQGGYIEQSDHSNMSQSNMVQSS